MIFPDAQLCSNVGLGRALSAGVSAPATWGHMIMVEDFVPSEDCQTSGVSLAMGTGVWDRARECFGDRIVVGWYHSHPNLGAFLRNSVIPVPSQGRG